MQERDYHEKLARTFPPNPQLARTDHTSSHSPTPAARLSAAAGPQTRGQQEKALLGWGVCKTLADTYTLSSPTSNTRLTGDWFDLPPAFVAPHQPIAPHLILPTGMDAVAFYCSPKAGWIEVCAALPGTLADLAWP